MTQGLQSSRYVLNAVLIIYISGHHSRKQMAGENGVTWAEVTISEGLITECEQSVGAPKGNEELRGLLPPLWRKGRGEGGSPGH